jgi:hypothetical protein
MSQVLTMGDVIVFLGVVVVLIISIGAFAIVVVSRVRMIYAGCSACQGMEGTIADVFTSPELIHYAVVCDSGVDELID